MKVNNIFIYIFKYFAILFLFVYHNFKNIGCKFKVVTNMFIHIHEIMFCHFTILVLYFY